MILCQLPVLHQFVLVDDRPGQDQLHLSGRKGSPVDARIQYIDEDFLSVVFRVEMRRRVVVVVHGYANAEKE